MKSVYEIADVRRLTTADSKIAPEGDFPVLSLLENDGWRRVGIVTVKRAFPFEAPDEFIVLADEEDKDLGFIRALSERTPEERALLEKELSRRYFMPKITHIEKVNDRKAAALYEGIDSSDGFYRSPVRKDSRSRMNVVFRLPTEELEAKFVKESIAAGMIGLKGHRSAGGIRASIYNAMPMEGIERLLSFMADFRKNN